jgi:hypothetical protein
MIKRAKMEEYIQKQNEAETEKLAKKSVLPQFDKSTS